VRVGLDPEASKSVGFKKPHTQAHHVEQAAEIALRSYIIFLKSRKNAWDENLTYHRAMKCKRTLQ
jgi:SET domain-containing protein